MLNVGWRFKIRTLFAVVTIGCVWLGMVANRAAIERQAIAVVTRHHGAVAFDWHDTEKLQSIGLDIRFGMQTPNDKSSEQQIETLAGQRPVTFLRRYFEGFLGDEYFQRIVSVSIPRIDKEPEELSPAEIVTLSKLPDLQHLALKMATLDDEHFGALRECKTAKTIHFTAANIDDSILQLADMHELDELSFSSSCTISKELIHRLRELLAPCKVVHYVD